MDDILINQVAVRPIIRIGRGRPNNRSEGYGAEVNL